MEAVEWGLVQKGDARNGYLGDHLAPCLVSLPVIRLLFQLLYHPLAGRSILKRELGDNSAKLVGLGVLYPVQRYSQPEDELVKAINNATVHNTQHNYPLGAVGEEIRHSGGEN